MHAPRLALAAVVLVVSVTLSLVAPLAVSGDEQRREVGVGKVDITPDYAIRLNGFGGRRAESEGVTQRIWAKALAIGSDAEGAAVLLAIDSLGVRLALVEEVAARLAKKRGIARERVALTYSHSHTTPMVDGTCPTIFSEPIPPEHQRRVERYTRELTDRLEQAALAALDDRAPARLERAVGRVTFAKNRRTEGGPVDHDLPLLVVRGEDGALRALYAAYACHCVTLSHNKISGDWSGYAQTAIEADHPGAVALVSIGCGSDANPSSGVTGDRVEVAAAQGKEIAAEVERLLAGELRPVEGRLEARLGFVDLPLETLPSQKELEERRAEGGAAGYNAAYQLEKLARGEKLLEAIHYPIQTWSFGESLAMVFLAGEVCVDYAHRLKRELDRSRLWLNAYANDFPCYIPSERLAREGGYGGGAEIVYFGLPAKLRAGLEQMIIDEVRRQVPRGYRAAEGE